jgi:YidC/Oxa1 family membrane protein insertase
MDKRTLLALVLMALVIVVTPMLFPSSRRPTAATTRDSLSAPRPTAAPNSTAGVTTPAQQVQRSPTIAEAPASPPNVVAESTVLATPRAKFSLVSPGAVPTAVRINGYADLRPGHRDSMVVLQRGAPLLHYRLATGADTVDLSTIPFAIQQSGGGTSVTLTSASPAISITYKATSDGFLTSVSGRVANAPAGSTLLIDLPHELRSAEADTLDDLRHLAYGYKLPRRDVTSVPFSKLDTVVRVDTGAMQWVSVRTKYWLVALMRPVSAGVGGTFHGLTMRGDTAVAKIKRRASATTSIPLNNGEFAFDVYVGPQSWQELHALGNELENVNPYAGFLHGVVQPFATIVMRVLLWMKATFRLNYGWVLVLFGVVIRLLLWPLNQKAMRTSMQMQRLQPELQEIQKKYKTDPDKQRDALVKLYQAHGMSPLSPMLGCLPMLLPMPVLFALYFVFQNTIEFRGVQFLWLPDISLRDPYYIIPIVMGASMFLLSWIGMRSMPPNPQTKMMSYMMPVMFTVMFLNFASGLNLYYAVQNIAALPQQWILTRERAKAAGLASTASATVPARGGGGGGGGGRKT